MKDAPSQGMVRPGLLVEWATAGGRATMTAFITRERTTGCEANCTLGYDMIWSQQRIEDAERRVVLRRLVDSRIAAAEVSA